MGIRYDLIICNAIKQVSLEEYLHNLDTYKLSEQVKVKQVWVNCTPANDSIHNS